jgi:hypothetical protein
VWNLGSSTEANSNPTISGQSAIQNKHAIRRQVHGQLKELWERNPFLSRYMKQYDPNPHDNFPPGWRPVDQMAQNNAKFGFRFMPLIKADWGIDCALDILFLRRDDPGALVKAGGDINNRIKILFDGFRMAEHENEVRGMAPEVDEDPFFCLLQDDSLINEVKITTDRLLTPIQSEESVNDVVLVIRVSTLVTSSDRAFWEFYTR